MFFFRLQKLQNVFFLYIIGQFILIMLIVLIIYSMHIYY